jgi:hypothetical protein
MQRPTCAAGDGDGQGQDWVVVVTRLATCSPSITELLGSGQGNKLIQIPPAKLKSGEEKDRLASVRCAVATIFRQAAPDAELARLSIRARATRVRCRGYRVDAVVSGCLTQPAVTGNRQRWCRLERCRRGPHIVVTARHCGRGHRVGEVCGRRRPSSGSRRIRCSSRSECLQERAQIRDGRVAFRHRAALLASRHRTDRDRVIASTTINPPREFPASTRSRLAIPLYGWNHLGADELQEAERPVAPALVLTRMPGGRFAISASSLGVDDADRWLRECARRRQSFDGFGAQTVQRHDTYTTG